MVLRLREQAKQKEKKIVYIYIYIFTINLIKLGTKSHHIYTNEYLTEEID